MRAWLEQRQAGKVPNYTVVEDSTTAEAAAEHDDDARLRAEVLAYMIFNGACVLCVRHVPSRLHARLCPDMVALVHSI